MHKVNETKVKDQSKVNVLRTIKLPASPVNILINNKNIIFLLSIVVYGSVKVGANHYLNEGQSVKFKKQVAISLIDFPFIHVIRQL